MGLSIVILGKMAALSLFLLRQAAELFPAYRLGKHLAADQMPGKG